ncbi:ABC transporter permease [Microvirga splendida]|uniref:ABC transporter permease n=1 Tax=Microvirga splendida TaxID=2795727 RepID=A0ABS0Y402_9HYPH|nr:ABC transporter permease [Microvirga splendida]MBJ6126765.1 ABC transporter permease [Microvirga splendida]
MTTPLALSAEEPQAPALPRFAWAHSPLLLAGVVILGIFVMIALLAPFLVADPTAINTSKRLKPPSEMFWFGTDHLGRDIFARTMVGTRNSLLVGFGVAISVTLLGVTIGLYAGFSKWGERIFMRLMDGLMAIPGVLLAIALVALLRGGLLVVIIAITIPEVPRMVRLVRSVVLTVKEQPFVDAAISVGSSTPKILWLHVLPNTIGPLSVQATYVAVSAIIAEAVLSFLGVGTPPEIPSWGNMMAEGRAYFQLAPWIIGFPGLMLSIIALTVNLMGDALRERLDPRLARRSGLK